MTKKQKQPNWWDRIMMAITFAEANEADTARDFLNPPRKRKDNRIQEQKDQRPELRV